MTVDPNPDGSGAPGRLLSGRRRARRGARRWASRRAWSAASLVAVVCVVLALWVPAPASVAQDDGSGPEAPSSEVVASQDSAEASMSIGQALVLGVVEGVTEYLPISSTGHLLVTQRLMGMGVDEIDKDAADAYAIVIQLGAILAIVILYWRRLTSMLAGLLGRDEEGRRVLIGLVVAFLPAAVIGVAGEAVIKDVLFGPWPVVASWFVGGVVLLVLVRTGLLPAGDADASAGAAPGGRVRLALEQITVRHALVIGFAQCLAMWPGTSRSLVTIVAAVLVGFRLAAAVEFSFLLGLATLGAATLYDLVRNGGVIVEAYGVAAPVVGFLAALVSAVVAVRWMVTYLQRHSLAIFGWYRIAVAAATAVLLVGGVM